jgi:MFS family permease
MGATLAAHRFLSAIHPPMPLTPQPAVTAAELACAKRWLVLDSAWASLAGSLYGGVILVGFALELGAGPSVVGLLSAIPLLAQAAQLPGIALVERLRQRRLITVTAVSVARTVILALAAVPYLPDRRLQLACVVAAQAAITVLGAIGGCSLNSWLHQLLPKEGLGAFFAQRLFWATVLAACGALAAGLIIDHYPFGDRIQAYSVVFAAAAAAGFVSSHILARIPEPRMHWAGPTQTIRARLAAPLRDAHFRRLIVLMASWNFTSNLAAPFVTVFLLRQLGYALSTVTTLSVASQITNALTLYLWGRLSDRLSNKSILAIALPAYFVSLFALAFVALPQLRGATLPLLFAVHIVMGAAAGGIGLASGNLGLKLAPPANGTSYLAAVSLAGAAAGGIAPILGGVLADWFSASQLSLLVKWVSPVRTSDITVLQFEHWQFLFAIAAALGLYVMHRLSRIAEGREYSNRVVMQELGMEALRTIDQLSSIAGMRVATILSFGRLAAERRGSVAERDADRRADRRDGEAERRRGVSGS